MNETFFESLSGVGWVGIVIWVIFIITVIGRHEWYTNYENRFPKFNMFDEWLYEDWHYYVFLVARFLLMITVLSIITRILFNV